jgi:exonuclease SbcD
LKKAMFIGDLHLRSVNPQMRIDSYIEELQDLIIQAFNLAELEKCGAVILLGDIFHNHEPDAKLRNDTIDLFRRNPLTGQKWQFNLYGIIGNHDLKYHNPEILDQTCLGTLRRTSLRIVESIPEYSVFCGHYCRGIEQMDFSGRTEKIHALHAYIMPEQISMLEEGLFVPVEAYRVNPECRLVITGHLHDGYGIIEREDGVLFCNPGALSREKASKSDLERPIQVAIAEISDDVSVEFRTLNYRPSEEIFDLDAIALNKGKKVEKKELADKLTEMREDYADISMEDPLMVFTKFAKDNEMSNEARDRVLSLLEEVIAKRK